MLNGDSYATKPITIELCGTYGIHVIAVENYSLQSSATYINVRAEQIDNLVFFRCILTRVTNAHR